MPLPVAGWAARYFRIGTGPRLARTLTHPLMALTSPAKCDRRRPNCGPLQTASRTLMGFRSLRRLKTREASHPGLTYPGSRHVRFLTVSRLALRPRPFEPCFMLVASLGLHPSERFPLEEPYTSRCQMPSCRCLSNSLAAVLRKRCRCSSSHPRSFDALRHLTREDPRGHALTMW